MGVFELRFTYCLKNSRGSNDMRCAPCSQNGVKEGLLCEEWVMRTRRVHRRSVPNWISTTATEAGEYGAAGTKIQQVIVQATMLATIKDYALVTYLPVTNKKLKHTPACHSYTNERPTPDYGERLRLVQALAAVSHIFNWLRGNRVTTEVFWM